MSSCGFGTPSCLRPELSDPQILQKNVQISGISSIVSSTGS
jgi:hypothetical protein